MAKNISFSLILACLLMLKGEASPRNEISATASGSDENSSNSSAVGVVSTTQDTGCGTSGQVTVNIQGGGGGVVGPQGERGPPGPAGSTGPAGLPGGGVAFTRWGRPICPDTAGTQLLYQGTMAGSAYDEPGSSEYLCLHKDPQFLAINSGLQNHRGRLYGTEYEAYDDPPAFGNMVRHNPPCSVCYTPTRHTKITIPARTSCPPSWTREYYGYYMSGLRHAQFHSRAPVCIDANSESVPGSAGHDVKSLLYFLETTCIGIHCPPYSNGAEITCVVCTK